MEKVKQEMKFTVSDLFIDCYKLINVININDKISLLSKRELLLLLILVSDTHDTENNIVFDNVKNYELELKTVLELWDSNSTTDTDLIYLSEVTGDASIDVSVLVDKNDGILPKPLSATEALVLSREIKINGLI
jgi:hypothetical protein